MAMTLLDLDALGVARCLVGRRGALGALFLAVVAFCALAGEARAQNPVTAVYPGAVATDNELLCWANNAQTRLSTRIDADDMTLAVWDSTGFCAPSVVKIGEELIKISAVGSGTLTVASGGRGFDGTTAAVHYSSSLVDVHVPAYAFHRMAAEIKATQTALGVNLANVAPPADTDDLDEGATNLYFTQARARAAVSGGVAPSAHATSHHSGGADALALGSIAGTLGNTALDAVGAAFGAGSGLDYSAVDDWLELDPTEFGNWTIFGGANASQTWTFDLSGTDPTMTFKSGEVEFGATVDATAYQQGGAALAFSHLSGSASDAQVPDTITLTSIGQAGDVDMTGIADGECLIYDGVTDNRLEPGACGSGGATALNDLTDVTAPSPSDGDALTRVGSAWVNANLFTPTTTDILAARMSANWGAAGVDATIDRTTDGGFLTFSVAGSRRLYIRSLTSTRTVIEGTNSASSLELGGLYTRLSQGNSGWPLELKTANGPVNIVEGYLAWSPSQFDTNPDVRLYRTAVSELTLRSDATTGKADLVVQGNILVKDVSVAGATTGRVDAGPSQGATDLWQWRNSAGATLSYVSSAGVISAPGFRVSGSAPSGHVIRCNGTDCVAAQLNYSDMAGTVPEINALETDGAAGIADTEIFIGTGAGTGNYAPISGDATLANNGALAVVDDSHNHTGSTISALDAADVTTGTFAMARLASGTPDGTKFIRDDGTLAVPGVTTMYVTFEIPFGWTELASKEIVAAGTLTAIKCKAPAGIETTVQVWESTAIAAQTTALTAATACTDAGVTITGGSLLDTAMAAGNYLVVEIITTSGSPGDQEEVSVVATITPTP